MKRILFFCDPAEFANREIAIGASEAMQESDAWFLRLYWPREPNKPESWSEAFRFLKPDALMFNAAVPPDLIRSALRKRIPVVAVASDTLPDTPIPLVMEDIAEEGAKAAEFFLASGFEHFACLDLEGPDEQRGKARGFRNRLKKAGHSCFEFELKRSGGTFIEMFGAFNPMRELRPWLTHLPSPCALLATTDAVASETVEVCIRLGMRVPDDIAILGMDNNPTLCRTCAPPLSSVRTAFREIGREAGRLILGWNWNRPAQRVVKIIPPVDIVERGSTRLRETDDPVVRRATQFIARHIETPFPINALAKWCDLSPQALAQHFHRVFGHPPVVEVSRQRIAHARHLLEEGNLPIHQVATRSGFRSAIRFCAVFRNHTSMTPMQYRRKTQSP